MPRFSAFLALLLMMPALLLGKDEGFTRALPGYQFQFPRDHGSHPDFRIEWWYFTGNVQDESGKPFGFKMTIFRSAQAPPSTPAESPLVADQLYLCHFAISDIASKGHAAWEVIGREGFGQAHASTTTLDVRVKDFSIRMLDDGSIELRAAQKDAGLNLRLVPSKPFVIHGENGVHQKADIAGQASHYITFTRLETKGELTWNGVKHQVSGRSWMDHEFGSDYLSDEQAGWDWFAIQLDNGVDLMLYQLRNKDGSVNTHSIGSIVDAEGKLSPIRGSEFKVRNTSTWTSPENGGVYPMGWEIEIPGKNAKFVVEPAFLEQEMVMRNYTNTAYWEGSVRISGTWNGSPTAGKGYVELVGYAGDFDLL